MCAGAQLGVVIGYMVTGYMTDALGWESSFYFFGQSVRLRYYVNTFYRVAVSWVQAPPLGFVVDPFDNKSYNKL